MNEIVAYKKTELRLCKCGCGEYTPLSKDSGKPLTYIPYHQNRNLKSKITREKMSNARIKWYKNNPEKAKLKAEKQQITIILEGTHVGEKNSNFGSKKFTGIPYNGPAWNKGLTKENNLVLKEIAKDNMGDKNPNWKGDNVEITALHNWIRRYKPKPEFCEECHKNKPYDLANISGEYKRDINDFEWLCRKCHMTKDGRIYNLPILHCKEVI